MGSGQVVGVLAFIPTIEFKSTVLFCKLSKGAKVKKKEAGDCPL